MAIPALKARFKTTLEFLTDANPIAPNKFVLRKTSPVYQVSGIGPTNFFVFALLVFSKRTVNRTQHTEKRLLHFSIVIR